MLKYNKQIIKWEETIMILVCNVCGYEYDTETEGEMPEDYTCPICGVDKDNFSEI